MKLINRRPDRSLAIILAVIPFVAVLVAYIIGSDIRRSENPADKLLPAVTQIVDTTVNWRSSLIVAAARSCSGRTLWGACEGWRSASGWRRRLGSDSAC